MAKMIPDILPETIQNNGERLLYSAARGLPDEYTVLYAYKYYMGEEAREQLREADFVFVHPSLGYVVVEVKQGEVVYRNGVWHEFKNGQYQPMHKDPVEQATTAMFAILEAYKNEAKVKFFPLGIRMALCFPECTTLTGVLPQSLKPGSVWTFDDLDRLEEKIEALFAGQEQRNEPDAIKILLNKVLTPTFNLFASLEDRIAMFNSSATKVLTEEQERILDETEEDSRKIFLGAAGTGKTYVAIEKARRLSREGKTVFLTCYNKNLTDMFTEIAENPMVTAKNFHDYLVEFLMQKGIELREPSSPDEMDKFYKETLPSKAFDYFSNVPDVDKFDAIIVDEGQDFREDWYLCLEAMLKEDGNFYIFADLNQNIFGNSIDALKNMEMSRHRLTVNMRNTEKINEWLIPFRGDTRVRSRLTGGIPVTCIAWKEEQEEKRLVEKEIGRLVSQGLPPGRITILSTHRKKNSSLAGTDKIKEWPLVEYREGLRHGIKFSTIRSFKGLEADVVFLIGVTDDSMVSSDADIYVGASRARYLLYVFHQDGWKPLNIS